MQTTVSTHYVVSVTGYAWQGFKAKVSYTLDYHPNEKQIKSLTGDFQHLTTIKIEKVETVTCISRKKVKVAA